MSQGLTHSGFPQGQNAHNATYDLKSDDLMPRRKPRLYPDLSQDPVERPVQVRRMHDPQEVKIYVKQLKKALKFLPLGSRAYYYVSGEILRANTQLKLLIPTGSTGSQGHDSAGSNSDSDQEN